jgi:hypothetical protein
MSLPWQEAAQPFFDLRTQMLTIPQRSGYSISNEPCEALHNILLKKDSSGRFVLVGNQPLHTVWVQMLEML